MYGLTQPSGLVGPSQFNVVWPQNLSSTVLVFGARANLLMRFVSLVLTAEQTAAFKNCDPQIEK